MARLSQVCGTGKEEDADSTLAVLIRTALAGGLASGACTAALHPIDTRKTLLQAMDKAPGLLQFVRDRGMRGVYQGVTPSFIGAFSGHGIRAASTEGGLMALKAVGVPFMLAQLVSAWFGTIVGTAARIPCEVLKQQLQRGNYPNTQVRERDVLMFTPRCAPALSCTFPAATMTGMQSAADGGAMLVSARTLLAHRCGLVRAALQPVCAAQHQVRAHARRPHGPGCSPKAAPARSSAAPGLFSCARPPSTRQAFSCTSSTSACSMARTLAPPSLSSASRSSRCAACSRPPRRPSSRRARLLPVSRTDAGV